MLYVALASLAVALVTAATLGSLLRYVIRQAAHERERLIDQLCHLTGRPWREAPAYQLPEDEPDIGNVWAIPEQMRS